MATADPETYHLSPTRYVPNSKLPALIYRNVLSTATPEGIQQTIEPNRWLKGGTWKAYSNHHFHSVTHECYAVYSGKSRLLLGRGPMDEGGGVEVDLAKGDVIVLPAGVAHCSLTWEDGYEYMGLYPQGSPQWDNNFCKAGPEETAQKAANAQAVPIPECDPIYGPNGPLVKLWAMAAA